MRTLTICQQIVPVKKYCSILHIKKDALKCEKTGLTVSDVDDL